MEMLITGAAEVDVQEESTPMGAAIVHVNPPAAVISRVSPACVDRPSLMVIAAVRITFIHYALLVLCHPRSWVLPCYFYHAIPMNAF
jgi:hypothetical protein